MQISFNGSVLEFNFNKDKSTNLNRCCVVSPTGHIVIIHTDFRHELLAFFIAGRFAEQFQYRFDTKYTSPNYVMKTIENRRIEIV